MMKVTNSALDMRPGARRSGRPGAVSARAHDRAFKVRAVREGRRAQRVKARAVAVEVQCVEHLVGVFAVPTCATRNGFDCWQLLWEWSRASRCDIIIIIIILRFSLAAP